MSIRTVRTLGRFASVGAAGALAYAFTIRPRMLRWGATEEEAHGALPGDEIVRTPRYACTHAVTIDATPAEVWPWIAQMGQGRGGLYSYTWLENLFRCRMHNADDIVPELLTIQPGDEIRLVPEDHVADLRYEVVRAEPEGVLVLKGPGEPVAVLESGFPYCSWAFVLREREDGTTRLLARSRSDFSPTFYGYLWNKYGLEPVHFLMERKMLLGIKQRAERTVPRPHLVLMEGTAA
jgi:hypothetical protein